MTNFVQFYTDCGLLKLYTQCFICFFYCFFFHLSETPRGRKTNERERERERKKRARKREDMLINRGEKIVRKKKKNIKKYKQMGRETTWIPGEGQRSTVNISASPWLKARYLLKPWKVLFAHYVHYFFLSIHVSGLEKVPVYDNRPHRDLKLLSTFSSSIFVLKINY